MITDFSHRLFNAFQLVVEAQEKNGMASWSETILRDRFISLLPHDSCKRMTAEKMIDNPSVTFLVIREFTRR